MDKTVSLRSITWQYLTVIIAIGLLGVMLIARFGWLAITEEEQRQYELETNLLQRQFSDLFGFYQGIAQRLSERMEVADILEFSDRTRAVNWAREVRRLIPASIGVALIDSDGVILGEPLQLNLGKQCVNDLNTMFTGRHVGSPPVHRYNPELAHFDITHEVVRNDEVIGILFISFSLDVIRQKAEKLVREGQVLIVEDSEGSPVAHLGVAHGHEQQGHEHHRVAIENTDWKIHYIKDDSGANMLFVASLLIVLIILFAIVVAMVVFSLRMTTLFQGDLGLIKEQLEGVYEGDKASLPSDRKVLSETSEIMADVWRMMGNIQEVNTRLKVLSINDELSGLLNRRGFNAQLEQAWDLSARGVDAVLVLLDLDYFKQVNDSLGHGIGDEVIIALAQALRARCRKSDVIARLGGDEFAVILNATLHPDELEQWYHGVAESFERLQQEIFRDRDSNYCTISAGAVVLDRVRYDWLQKQLDVADRALYQAKEQGRGRLVYNS